MMKWFLLLLIGIVIVIGAVWVVAPDADESVSETAETPHDVQVEDPVHEQPVRAPAPEQAAPVGAAPVDVVAPPVEQAVPETAEPAPAAPSIEPAIPDLTLETYDGTPVALHDLVGTPLVLNSWAAWCPFCVKELPDFATAQAQLGNDVRIVAINRAESLSTARSFSDERGASNLMLLLDPTDSFYTSIGGFSMPETLFINSDGSLNLHKRGVMTLDEILQAARNLR